MSGQQELLSIIMLGLGATLWPLGGFRWKGFRRFILPLAILGCLAAYGISFIQSLIAAILLCAATHLPYGDSTPWFKPGVVDGKFRGSKLLTALSYSVPSLVIGITWWQIITPCVFLVTFTLSNLHATSKDFTWKLCEGLTGVTIICTLIASLQRQWGGF